MIVRSSLWALAIGLCAWAALGAKRGGVFEEMAGALDQRPGVSVLFIGNSRTYVNDLPHVLREMADSAGSPLRYDVAMRAWGGATLHDHWGNAGDQAALEKHWDFVILQTQSGTFADPRLMADFNTYGAKLSDAARAQGAKVAVISNWTSGANYFQGDQAASRAYGDAIARGTSDFSRATGDSVIDFNSVFADAAANAPEIALLSDGNHPTPAGTYLAALTLYRFLTHDSADKVTWRPSGMSEDVERRLKDIAARHLS